MSIARPAKPAVSTTEPAAFVRPSQGAPVNGKQFQQEARRRRPQVNWYQKAGWQEEVILLQ
jgi:hypothetical protein